MGKTALIAIAAFAMMGAIYGLTSSRSVVGTTEAIASHQYEIMARNAAVTGFEEAKHRLSESFASSSFSGGFEYANYDVSVSVSGSTAKVTSVGETTSSTGGLKTFTVVSEFELQVNSYEAEEVPLFMQYALMSDQDLSLGGDMNIDTVRVEGSELTNLNANVHTNGKLSANGNKLKVRGFGTYKTVENVTHVSAFDPYNNPTRDDVIKRVDESVEIPPFDAAEMAARMNLYYSGVDSTTGSVTLSGTYDFTALGATRENPFVWHIQGDLSTTGGVTVDGYVMFLIEGNAKLNGNITVPDKTGKSENSLAIYTNGSIEVGGSASNLWMQTYAKAGVKIDGNASIYGNVATSGTVQTKGSPRIKYFPASPALTQLWYDPITRLKLVAYREY